ncbi:hypothetical protein HELRODRAFT_188714 [Helobdella robusta]|uniref:Conserved oligomeric Golgi complex subunit 5 n=1 Tax=Helobdella robusta TaxID=6412 RepID=T1FQA5_HELRO|nr:hypothetical protein HELRODRAFT_188714 [Helobdella robusta]ESO02463.1 hypothetical protein HELRODRAFT_188714 [Helobdella robusta]
MDNPENFILDQLTKDDSFKAFTENEFDAKSYATKIIEGQFVSQQLANLSEGINLLNKEIHRQVSDHHEDLLSQATGIEALESVLQTMQTRSHSLLSALERIRSVVLDPYCKIVARTQQLKRLQETCGMLRQIVRVIYISKRLQAQLQGGNKEITKAAQSINELDYVSTNGYDLSNIDVIEPDRKLLKLARKQVEGQSVKMLEQGMILQNQTQVATALQIFYNLNTLETTIDKTMSDIINRVRDNLKSSLDINNLVYQGDRRGGPGKVSGLSSGNTAALRAAFWMSLEKLMDELYSSYSQVLHLQKVLSRKRDPVTHALLLEHLKSNVDSNYSNLLKNFWLQITKLLSDEFNKSAENSPYLKQALEGEYPKLLRLFNDLWRRINSLGGHVTFDSTLIGGSEILENGGVGENGKMADEDYDPEKELIDCANQFETTYLSKSLSRLFDPINIVFSSNSSNIPNDNDIEGIVRAISSELAVSSFDSKLCTSIARNVGKTIILTCSKFEQLIMIGGEATQVIGPPTEPQKYNANIANSLYKFYQASNKVFSNMPSLPAHVIQHLNEVLQGVNDLIVNTYQPLLTSVGSAIEDILLTMHNEDFSQPLPADNGQQQQVSLYMKELQLFISRVAATYISLYQCADLIMQSLNQTARRCLDLFVRHTTLIWYLGEGGKRRLANDYAQIEVAVGPLCNKMADLGRSYRLVRTVRPMLFQAPETIVQSPSLGDSVPVSLVLNMLFSRGHPNLRPAYQTAGWNCSRYSKWLDDHPNEKDRLHFIRGSLESYALSITNRGGKEFVAIYPYMIELLQKGLTSL